MITGTTASGFDFQIEESALDDMELLELIAAAEENPLEIPKVVEKLLGAEQKKALYDSLRTERGNVPIADVFDAVTSIVTANNVTGKKS